MKKQDQGYSKYSIVSFVLAIIPLAFFYSAFLFQEYFKNNPIENAWTFLSLILITSLIFGFLGLSEIKKQKIKGKWLANIGIALSVLFLLFIIILIMTTINPS